MIIAQEHMSITQNGYVVRVQDIEKAALLPFRSCLKIDLKSILQKQYLFGNLKMDLCSNMHNKLWLIIAQTQTQSNNNNETGIFVRPTLISRLLQTLKKLHLKMEANEKDGIIPSIDERLFLKIGEFYVREEYHKNGKCFAQIEVYDYDYDSYWKDNIYININIPSSEMSFVCNALEEMTLFLN